MGCNSHQQHPLLYLRHDAAGLHIALLLLAVLLEFVAVKFVLGHHEIRSQPDLPTRYSV